MRMPSSDVLSKAGFEAIQQRVGGLGLTKADNKELLSAVREAIAAQTQAIKDKDGVDKAVWAALETEVSDIADKLSEPLAEKLTGIIAGRVPIDLMAPVAMPDNFGELTTRLDKKANEIMKDVVDFHSAYSGAGILVKESEANTILADILDTGEADSIRADVAAIEKAFGNRDEVKVLKAQARALENMAKVFAKQYAVLDGKETMDAIFIAYDLALAYKQQDEKVKEALGKKQNLVSNDLNISLSGTEMDQRILDAYKQKVAAMIAPVTPSDIEAVYLREETGLTRKSVSTFNFRNLAYEIALESYSTIPFDAENPEALAIEKAKDIAFQRAKKSFRAFRDRGLTAGGKVVDKMVDAAKAAGELGAAMGEEASVAAGFFADVLGRQEIKAGIEKFKSRPQRPTLAESVSDVQAMMRERQENISTDLRERQARQEEKPRLVPSVAAVQGRGPGGRFLPGQDAIAPLDSFVAKEAASAEIASRLQAQIDQAEEDIVRITAEAQDDDYIDATYGGLLASGSMTEQEVRDAESERLREATERRQEAIDKADAMGLILRNPFGKKQAYPDYPGADRPTHCSTWKGRFDEIHWVEPTQLLKMFNAMGGQYKAVPHDGHFHVSDAEEDALWAAGEHPQQEEILEQRERMRKQNVAAGFPVAYNPGGVRWYA